MIDFIVSLACAVLSAMGVGGGGLLIIYLTLVKDMPQLVSQSINLLFFLPSALISIVFKAKELHKMRRLAFIICPFAVSSSILFSFICSKISGGALRKFFGAFLILAALYQLFFTKDKKQDTKAQNTQNNGRKKN